MTLTNYYSGYSVKKIGQKVRIGRRTFDSKSEFRRFCYLKMMQKKGFISSLNIHKKFFLSEDRSLKNGKAGRTWTCDFVYYCDGRKIVEDIKSEYVFGLENFSRTMKIIRELYGVNIRVIPSQTPNIEPDFEKMELKGKLTLMRNNSPYDDFKKEVKHGRIEYRKFGRRVFFQRKQRFSRTEFNRTDNTKLYRHATKMA